MHGVCIYRASLCFVLTHAVFRKSREESVNTRVASVHLLVFLRTLGLKCWITFERGKFCISENGILL